MAPIADPPASSPVTRVRTRPRRREPHPLEQLPAWHDLVPVMDPTLADPPASGGMDALLGGLDPDQRRGLAHAEARHGVLRDCGKLWRLERGACRHGSSIAGRRDR